MQTKSINVLLVEDSEDDALILARHMQKGGFDVTCLRVDSASDMRSALEESTWDICITDHNMPGFSSGAAMDLINELELDLPTIIVSGSIGEDVAVQAMKSGAHDYIMKDNLNRLVPAIERTMADAAARSAQRQAEETIRFLAYHDSLTKLNNRYEFENRLKQAMENAKHNTIQHTVLYLDLDQFKIINDTCGHVAGDELLKQLSENLKAQVREGDTLARLGGDEFGVLLENCPLNRAKIIAEKLLDTVRQFSFLWDGRVFSIGVSIGMVVIDQYSANMDFIMSAADMACYEAKQQGRNRVAIYHECNEEISKRRGEMDWVGRINLALELNAFQLFKQAIKPMGNSCDGSSFFEYFIRMQSEEGCLILPELFLPAAERYNLMPAVDKWVIENVFKHLACLKENAAISSHDLHFVNLSGASLDEQLFSFIVQKLEQYEVPASSLCFEVTETVAVSNIKATSRFITQCRSLGIKFALDDFGTGFCSFSYLKNMPVDFLKIDGSFVKNMLHDAIDCSIVESVINIGRVAGLKTIAEFVEKPEVLAKLRKLNVDYVQGFCIEKPMPAEFFTQQQPDYAL